MYFNKIFHTDIEDVDSIRYPYTLRNGLKRIAANQNAFDAFKENLIGLSLKDVVKDELTLREALGDDGQTGTQLLIDFLPLVFTDSIVSFGLRQSVSRRDFPRIVQGINSRFRHRFRWRHESVGLYREGDTIQHAASLRDHQDYAFIKLADSMVYPDEFLNDTPIDEISQDLQLSSSKSAMLEDRTFWHELLYWSSDRFGEQWTDHNFCLLDIPSGSDTVPTAADLLTAMQNAYLSMTTRQEDALSPGDLKWYISPEAYAILWGADEIRRFDFSGREAQVLNSTLPNFFGIENVITQLGYFNDQDEWTNLPYDILLVGSGAAATRVRNDFRMEPFRLASKQMEGWILSERYRPYVINPIRYCRISNERDFTDIKSIENVNYQIRDLSKTEDSTSMISITPS